MTVPHQRSPPLLEGSPPPPKTTCTESKSQFDFEATGATLIDPGPRRDRPRWEWEVRGWATVGGRLRDRGWVTRTASRARASSGRTRKGLMSRFSMAAALATVNMERRERVVARMTRSAGGRLAAKAGEEPIGGDRLDHGPCLGFGTMF